MREFLPATAVSTGSTVRRATRGADAENDDALLNGVAIDVAGQKLPGRDEAARLAGRIVHAQGALRIARISKSPTLSVLTPVCAPNAVCLLASMNARSTWRRLARRAGPRPQGWHDLVAKREDQRHPTHDLVAVGQPVDCAETGAGRAQDRQRYDRAGETLQEGCGSRPRWRRPTWSKSAAWPSWVRTAASAVGIAAIASASTASLDGRSDLLLESSARPVRPAGR